MTSSWRKPVRPVHVLTSSSAGTISPAASKQRAAAQSHWAHVTGRRRLCSPSSLHTDVNECTVSWPTVSANIHRHPRTNRRKQSLRAGRRAENSEEEIKSWGWGWQRKYRVIQSIHLSSFMVPHGRTFISALISPGSPQQIDPRVWFGIDFPPEAVSDAIIPVWNQH